MISGTDHLYLLINPNVVVIQKVGVKIFPDAFCFIPSYPDNFGEACGLFSAMNEGDSHVALNDSKIRAAKSLTKSYKLTDSQGLYLTV